MKWTGRRLVFLNPPSHKLIEGRPWLLLVGNMVKVIVAKAKYLRGQYAVFNIRIYWVLSVLWCVKLAINVSCLGFLVAILLNLK